MSSKTYRQGAVGALLDEYEKAAEELKESLKSVSQQDFVLIVDKETKDPECVSIQTIMQHVVSSGYAYAFYIRKQFGDPLTERKENYDLQTPEIACSELDKMLQYTEETLSNKSEITFDEVLNNIIKVTCGQSYDFEQMLEHAIVHILRHRRQIEIFKLIL